MISFQEELEYEVSANSKRVPDPYKDINDDIIIDYVIEYLEDSDEYYDEALINAICSYSGDLMSYISYEFDNEPHRSTFGDPYTEIWTYTLFIDFDDKLFRLEAM